MLEDRYISASELSSMLSLTRGAIYSMRRRGMLPPGTRIGGVRRWSLTELMEFLKAGGTHEEAHS